MGSLINGNGKLMKLHRKGFFLIYCKFNDTVVLRNLQKILDKGPISAKGLRCHRNSLATIGYSRYICPKSPKNVSYCIKYLEKTLNICEFFDEICISDFAKMG